VITMTTRIGIDTRSILPRRYSGARTLTARDRIRVMESRARRGDLDAIAWVKAYTDTKNGMWS